MNASRISAVGLATLVTVVLPATTTQSRADQLRSKDQRPQWEYKVEHCGYNSGLVGQLNQIGNEGWELVQIADGMGVFKRVKAARDKTLGSAVQIELLEDLSVIVIRGGEEDVRSVVSTLRESEQRRPKSTPSGNDEGQGDKGQQVSEKDTENSTPRVTKYERMKKKDLQEELGRLQGEILDAERTASQAKEEASIAARGYKSASDDEKAAALLRMIEAEASFRDPNERYKQIFLDFNAAKEAYLRLLVAE